MVNNKEQKKTPWVDDAIKHLAKLVKEAIELADEDDVLPTTEALAKGTEILKTHSQASAPKISVTIDGDLMITWENHGDAFKVLIRPNSQVLYFRNNKAVKTEEFGNLLTAAPA
ncbi:MAG: hypothetical protein EKK48_24640 [Candidatus Melainabacteria bacterium]|nr:MAG: hypothetical protein EKK48_24640 [Candidatus Melainabacteria bacterium]